jgi:hypothetical protein
MVSETFEKAGYQGVLRISARESGALGYPYCAASNYVMLGEKNAAFAALEQAAAVGNHIDRINLDPALDNLRSDPLFATCSAASGRRNENQ